MGMYICKKCGSVMRRPEARCSTCGCRFANYSGVRRRPARETAEEFRARSARAFLVLTAVVLLIVLWAQRWWLA